MKARVGWIAAAGAVAVAASVAVFTGSFDSPSAGRQAGRGKVRFPVEIAAVEARNVEYSIAAVGSVEAFEVVQVTVRVTGIVERVHFAEGDMVKPGQALAEIEPERYRLAVQSARATLEKADAALADAEASLARREGVNAQNPGLIPGEELETRRTRVRAARAEDSQARTALDLAELNLRDAFVRAPVAGTIQTRTVQTGQYVQPGVVIATLVRRDPLLLRFQVSEGEAMRLQPGMPAFFTVGEGQQEFISKIVHVAETAALSSRMVAVTAEVDDPGVGSLRPGAFAQVRVPAGGASGAPVIQQIAVRPSERGFLAFVVQDSVAKERILTLGMRTADGRVEVRSGVSPGERLVIRGAEALFDGAMVRVIGAGSKSK